MTKSVMLDSGPLGRIAHPKRNLEVTRWFDDLLAANTIILLPEIADYEVRRNFLLEGLTRSVERLEQLASVISYVPITTTTMRTAARLWSSTRRSGQPTADPKELDGDVILAAQAIHSGAVVATDNVGHLSRLVEAYHWQAVTPELLKRH